MSGKCEQGTIPGTLASILKLSVELRICFTFMVLITSANWTLSLLMLFQETVFLVSYDVQFNLSMVLQLVQHF